MANFYGGSLDIKASRRDGVNGLTFQVMNRAGTVRVFVAATDTRYLHDGAIEDRVVTVGADTVDAPGLGSVAVAPTRYGTLLTLTANTSKASVRLSGSERREIMTLLES